MVKKIKNNEYDFVQFLNEHEGSFTIKLINGEVFQFKNDEFKYDENYLYIHKKYIECMIKLDCVCCLFYHK